MSIPQAGSAIVVKKKPSAFHGTPLLGYLIDRGVDTVVVLGGATSNCVRATKSSGFEESPCHEFG